MTKTEAKSDPIALLSNHNTPSKSIHKNLVTEQEGKEVMYRLIRERIRRGIEVSNQQRIGNTAAAFSTTAGKRQV